MAYQTLRLILLFYNMRTTVRFPDFRNFIHILDDVFIKKIYEVEFAQNPKLIVDCGANIGIASLYFKLKYPKVRLVCFEPSSLAFSYLTKNLSKFGRDCQLYNQALVGDKRTRAKLAGNHAHPYAHLAKGEKIGEYEEVNCTRLSDKLPKKTKIDLLKVDIEGMETEVISELAKSRRLENVRQAIIEVHRQMLNSKQIANLISLLAKNDFEIVFKGGNVHTFMIHAFRS